MKFNPWRGESSGLNSTRFVVHLSPETRSRDILCPVAPVPLLVASSDVKSEPDSIGTQDVLPTGVRVREVGGQANLPKVQCTISYVLRLASLPQTDPFHLETSSSS